LISITMLVEGAVVVCDCSSLGTWISRTLRSVGMVSMKITSSTSSTSMKGVMLMSLFMLPLPLVAIAMSVVPFGRDRGLGQRPLVDDGGDHGHAGIARQLDRLLDVLHLQVLVGLEIQDLVGGVGGGEDLAQPRRHVALGDR